MIEEQQKKVGSVLTGLAGLLFSIAVMMKFHRGLLLLSNLLFFAGLIVILGIEKFQKLFTQQQRLPGTICFGIGIFCIVINKGFLGFLSDLVGIYICFGGFVRMMITRVRKLIKKHDEEELPR